MTPQTATPPARSQQQRDSALSKANVVRKLRAADKELIKDREMDARELIMDPSEHWKAAQVAVVLLAIPSVGHTKVEKMLFKLHISSAKTLGGLTDAQRQRLCDALGRFYGQL